jgi:hypothetical protein
MQAVISSLAMLRRWGQALGPYLVLEILLPGGTLLALLLFLYRRRSTVLSPAFEAVRPGGCDGPDAHEAHPMRRYR